jgi:hypothetical protein
LNRTIDLRQTPPTDRAITRGSSGSAQSVQQPRDPHGIAVVTCVNNGTQYNICLRYVDALQIPSGYTVEKIAVLGAASMAEGYQRAMEASTARYKIYIHQDVYLIHRGLLHELVTLFRTYPRLGLVGVVGPTRLPATGIWWVNNLRHCYGRLWEYYLPTGLPASLFFKRRVLHFSRFRSFVGDYMPAAAVDGLFLATQYDLPWINPLGGFELYEQVQALEFINAGLEVGIARQEAIWCLHWGPLQEPTREQRDRRDFAISSRAAAFRRVYPEFLGVPARRLYEHHRRAARWLDA